MLQDHHIHPLPYAHVFPVRPSASRTSTRSLSLSLGSWDYPAIKALVQTVVHELRGEVRERARARAHTHTHTQRRGSHTQRRGARAPVCARARVRARGLVRTLTRRRWLSPQEER